uniref:Uncharacterized protein n=1 Tax=Timema tahoe TaxID=61484 RepID=A0A7R9IMD3_9NEOP|nr:unnamed protein product [Timema tahoe]
MENNIFAMARRRLATGRRFLTSYKRDRGKPCLEQTTLITPDRDSNLDLPVIGSLVYCESNALDHAAIEAANPSVGGLNLAQGSQRDFRKAEDLVYPSLSVVMVHFPVVTGESLRWLGDWREGDNMEMRRTDRGLSGGIYRTKLLEVIGTRPGKGLEVW